MVKSYHVICIPLYFWEFYDIKTKDQLLSFARVLSRMFKFENTDVLKELEEEDEFEKKEDEIRNLSILGSHLIYNTEIYGKREITKYIAKKNLVDNFNIKHVFITDYSFEIISSNPEIISNDTIYKKLATEISKVTFKNCYDSNESANLFESLAIVASLKIITCDSSDEIEELTKEYKLEKVTDYFYINNYNTFNFITPPWDKLFIPDLIVTLKPKTMAKNMNKFHQTADEFGFYVTLAHAIGKIYAISASMRSASANLIMTSWNLDEIGQNFESTFNYWKRNFNNNEMDFYNLFREFKELILPLTPLANQTSQVKIIEQQYGPVISFQIKESLNMLHNSKANKFLKCPNLIIDAFMNDVEIFGETLIEFLNKFQDTINNWREIYRSKVNHNQMLGTMIALLVAIVALIISLIGDKLWQQMVQLIYVIR